ncbi:MAG: cysteine desulfurase [Candidatus Nealsonbacteria bacterium]|nr:cysteine desulfurase [Candidatus Nealsonbacteria bacterium]
MAKEIYLDYSATTPIDKKVLDKMLPYLQENYGNPSSIYALGQRSLFGIDNSRKIISEFLGAKADEVLFVGSATEANNMAILGLIKKLAKKDLHVITSKIEHPSVLETCRALEKEGASVTYLPVGKNGIVQVSDVEKSIQANTVLVSVMYANNEIGTIQPIKEIGVLIKRINEKREAKNKIFFHTDAVQGSNYLNCDVNDLGVDMLSFSGHKIYGPKGIGVLYVQRGTPIKPIIYGGGQEQGLRPGTENVASIVGMGEAIRLVSDNKEEQKSIKKLRDKLIKEVLKIPRARLNGSETDRLINNANFSFKGAEGESIVMALDQKGIFASTGSACSSNSLEPSHVLMGIGLSQEEAHCSLRVTLGRKTKEKEVDELIKVLPGIIERLREISGR